MIFQTDVNYYDTLEIRPDSSAQEIRNAYLRLKASYRKDNPALYSVLDPSETEEMINKIEEAFHILSDPDARREYDERNGFIERIDRKIFAIDRATPQNELTPPMDAGFESDPLLAPSTEFEGMAYRGETVTTTGNTFQPSVRPPVQESTFIDRRSTTHTPPPPADAVLSEIANETEWRGFTIKRLRELRRYSLDDIAQATKISKTYIIAIEEESFAKLPAPVFVRGFLLQIARTLKIPPEPLAAAYMQRYQKR